MDSQSTCCTSEGPSDNYSHICNMSRDMGCHHKDPEVQQVWSETQAPPTRNTQQIPLTQKYRVHFHYVNTYNVILINYGQRNKRNYSVCTSLG